MIAFLIQSTICLTVFLSFYHLVLEREKMHEFNRFYLLGTILISLSIPLLTFEIIKIVPVVENIKPISLDAITTTFTENSIQENVIPLQEPTNYTPYLLWLIYGLITSALIARFAINCFKLISKSKSNPIVKYKNANLVLVDEKTIPHTFLNFIYINFEDYNNRNIEDELYTHELVHVNQKHTIDILFIEVLKVFFWFNPLFIFYKKAIQLNHEFLADEEIVKTYNNVPFYQNLLLQKSSNVQTIYLASNLNYLVTKKRLIMMTKSTSQKIAILKKLAIAPILIGLVYFFCIKIVAQEKVVAIKAETKNSKITDKDKIRDLYYSGVYVKLIDEKSDRNEVTLYENLSLEDRRKYLDLVPEMMIEKEIPEPLFEKMKSKNMPVWINGKVKTKEEIKKYKRSDFSYYTYSFVHKNARSKRFPQEYQYTLYTKEYFDENLKNNHIHFSSDTIKIIYASYETIKKDKFINRAPIDTVVWYNDRKEGYNIYINDSDEKFVEDEKIREKRDFAYEDMTITIIDKKRNVNVTKKYEDLDLKLKQRYLQTHMFYLKDKKTPTKKLFDAFKDKNKYLIFLNDRRIENTVLNKMKVNDIYYYAEMLNPPTSPRDFLYFIYSKDYYEKKLKGKIKDEFGSNKIKYEIY
ncbi:M56 family metallopeptidase [uncultured Flavobacterium sp.]|jgi:beta-lactamase regulating signal transducer with metallopeptidase domain|uniref:M56 family metallopeptidase n=1 Tax=uncultured Flavobacterium sp. TaxID=165435 RepID=UPI0025983FD7|nr:M56 family metallopeptidase [uncultured Flavobacterium sp.]